MDAAGNLYVVNLGQKGTIGRVRPGASTSELFAKLPDGSIGNGIRFDREGRMYVADFKAHTIFVLEPGQATPRPYFPPQPRSGLFDQPNDLAIAADGTLYASDPKRRTGRIWRIRRAPDGTARAVVMTSSRAMGRTNGLDLSPDGRTLYVGKSSSFELWAYGIEGDRLVAPRRLVKFDADLDGLRTDVDGKIYVARVESGTVDVVDPQSRTVIRRVAPDRQEPDQPDLRRARRKDRLRHAGRWRLRRNPSALSAPAASPACKACPGRARSGGRRSGAELVGTRGCAPQPSPSCPGSAGHPRLCPGHTPTLARAGGSLTFAGMKGGWVYFMSNRRNGVLYVGVTSSLSHRAWQHARADRAASRAATGSSVSSITSASRTSATRIQREKTIKHSAGAAEDGIGGRLAADPAHRLRERGATTQRAQFSIRRR